MLIFDMASNTLVEDLSMQQDQTTAACMTEYAMPQVTLQTIQISATKAYDPTPVIHGFGTRHIPCPI